MAQRVVCGSEYDKSFEGREKDVLSAVKFGDRFFRAMFSTHLLMVYRTVGSGAVETSWTTHEPCLTWFVVCRASS